MYVIAAVQSNRPDKVNEFFEKMTPQLQGQSGWNEWFGEKLFFYFLMLPCGCDPSHFVVSSAFLISSFLVLCLCCDGCPSPYSRSPHVSFQAVFPCSISVPLLLALLFSASVNLSLISSSSSLSSHFCLFLLSLSPLSLSSLQLIPTFFNL